MPRSPRDRPAAPRAGTNPDGDGPGPEIGENVFSPGLRVHLEIEAGYYDRVFSRGRGIQRFWHSRRLELVRKNLPPEATRVVDLGCGAGTFLGRFLPDSAGGVGVDFAGPQVQYARLHYARPGLEFREGDATRFESNRPFDAAVSVELIEHLPREQTRAFLATVRKLLVPGGTLVLVTPNYRSAWPLTEWLISKCGPVDYLAQHVNPFTRERLVRAVTEAGFHVTKCESFFVAAPFLAALSTRAAETVLGWERSLLPGLGSELLLVARVPVPDRAPNAGTDHAAD